MFAAPALAARLQGDFPRLLDGAPFLLPGEDVAHRGALLQWFERMRIRPAIVAEFDDSALMKAFGQAGDGVFAAPTTIADYVCRQYGRARARRGAGGARAGIRDHHRAQALASGDAGDPQRGRARADAGMPG